MRRSVTRLGLHSARSDGGFERREVPLVLVGVSLGERGQCPVEDIRLPRYALIAIRSPARAWSRASVQPLALPYAARPRGLMALITSEPFQSFTWARMPRIPAIPASRVGARPNASPHTIH